MTVPIRSKGNLIARSLWQTVRPVVPEWAIELALQLKGPIRHQLEATARVHEELLGGAPPERSEYEPRWPVTVGIFRDRPAYCAHNILACQEMGVPFVLLDLETPDWLEQIKKSGCDGFLVWPSVNLCVWKEVYDERLRWVTVVTGRPTVPAAEELWLFESKRRLATWLLVHGVPHPETRIFLREEDALEWVSGCRLPIVLKTDAGASSHGVFVLRTRREARRAVETAFRCGIRLKRGDRRDRAWGYVLLQEHVEHEHEWRVVRVGNDYLCRQKTRLGDFASGGGRVDWAIPRPGLLAFVEQVTNLGPFRSMALDVFENSAAQGPQFLVNEMQCLVGPPPAQEQPERGRWFRCNERWEFVPGAFDRNAFANMRLAMLLRDLGLTARVDP